MTVAEGLVPTGILSGSLQVLRVDESGHALADPRVIERLDEILALLRPKGAVPGAVPQAVGYQIFKGEL